MNSFNDIKARIEKLGQDQIASLEQWLDERDEWRRGNLKECFVIMPFSMTRDGRSKDYWTNFFDNFLTESLAACGYRAKRSEPTPGNIVEGIIEDLAWSELVVAVLTDFNPNVWYELGIRHSLRRRGTIMISQDDQISTLPFDLKHHGVAAYRSTLDRASFIEQLRPQLDRTDGKTDDSPVSGFLNSGLSYCIHRALAGRREVMKRLRQFSGIASEAAALSEVDKINRDWARQQMQMTLFKDDRVLRHKDVPTGTNANACFRDSIMGNESQYPRMKSYGNGLWLGSIERCVGRVTAVAYEILEERDWLVAVEAHVRQGDL